MTAPVVRPPWQVQQRAADAAFMLRSEWWDRLPIEHRVAVEVVVRLHPGRIGWSEARDMLRLYGAVVDVRV